MLSCPRFVQTLFMLGSCVLAMPVLAAAPVSGFYGDGQEQRTASVDKAVLDDYVFKVNQLQQEVRELRGLVEEQSHTIIQLKQQQEQGYADLERRLPGSAPSLQQKQGLSRLKQVPVPRPTSVPPSPSYEEVMPPQDESAPTGDRPPY